MRHLLPLLLMASGAPTLADGAPPCRRIETPSRIGRMPDAPSVAFPTRAAFEAFVKAWAGEGKPDAFLQALIDAKADFAKETLVLVRHTQPSSTDGVGLRVDGPKDGVLTCTLEVTSGPGLPDTMSHVFPMVVDKARVTRVEVVLYGKVVEVLFPDPVQAAACARKAAESFLDLLRAGKWEAAAAEVQVDEACVRRFGEGTEAVLRGKAAELFRRMYGTVKPGEVVDVQIEGSRARVSYRHDDLDGFTLKWVEGRWRYVFE